MMHRLAHRLVVSSKLTRCPASVGLTLNRPQLPFTATALQSFSSHTTQRCNKVSASTQPKEDRDAGVSVVLSESTDIHFNLALESFLHEQLTPRQPTLFLWRNSPTIVIGRNQNIWTECDVNRMKDNGISLARRYSGGGAVYQDLGNSCFTFLSPTDVPDTPPSPQAPSLDPIAQRGLSRTNNNEIILNALRSSFNLEAQASGRNDITIDGKKSPHTSATSRLTVPLTHPDVTLFPLLISQSPAGTSRSTFTSNNHSLHALPLTSQFSGAAFKHAFGVDMHHGTLMRDVDFTALQRYLTPSAIKLKSKGVASVAGRVLNLSEIVKEITHEQVCE
eukprot:GHVN01013559.1.p1 GENE.GHVN01013559.1~~GHVN01013559.1.p1  ORF type:complete len:334 (+),score=42.85 GHVN01013559.1:147-1148(+)